MHATMPVLGYCAYILVDYKHALVYFFFFNWLFWLLLVVRRRIVSIFLVFSHLWVDLYVDFQLLFRWRFVQGALWWDLDAAAEVLVCGHTHVCADNCRLQLDGYPRHWSYVCIILLKHRKLGRWSDNICNRCTFLFNCSLLLWLFLYFLLI